MVKVEQRPLVVEFRQCEFEVICNSGATVERSPDGSQNIQFAYLKQH